MIGQDKMVKILIKDLSQNWLFEEHINSMSKVQLSKDKTFGSLIV